MFFIANDKKYMGENKINPFLKISGALGLIVIVLLAVVNFIDIFLK